MSTSDDQYAREKVESAEKKFMEWMKTYKPDESDMKAISKSSIYPLYGGLFGSLGAGLLSNIYLAKRYGKLSQKLAVNLIASTCGFFAGTYMGAHRGAKIFFSAQDSKLVNEYKKLIELRKKNGLPVPGFLRGVDTSVPASVASSDDFDGESSEEGYFQDIATNDYTSNGYPPPSTTDSYSKSHELPKRLNYETKSYDRDDHNNNSDFDEEEQERHQEKPTSWEEIRRKHRAAKSSEHPHSSWDSIRKHHPAEQAKEISDNYDDPFATKPRKYNE